jgi:hypothetical protein
MESPPVSRPRISYLLCALALILVLLLVIASSNGMDALAGHFDRTALISFLALFSVAIVSFGYLGLIAGSAGDPLRSAVIASRAAAVLWVVPLLLTLHYGLVLNQCRHGDELCEMGRAGAFGLSILVASVVSALAGLAWFGVYFVKRRSAETE